MQDKVIGILAGMGPMSTAPFVDTLLIKRILVNSQLSCFK